MILLTLQHFSYIQKVIHDRNFYRFDGLRNEEHKRNQYKMYGHIMLYPIDDFMLSLNNEKQKKTKCDII